MDNYNIIGQRIRVRRKILELTQSQLGAALVPPMSTSSISGYEIGTSQPDIDTLHRLAVVLQCSMAFLTGESDKIDIIERKAIAQDSTTEAINEVAEKLSEAARAKLLFYARGLAEAEGHHLESGDEIEAWKL